MKINIKNEINSLHTVVLGIAHNIGTTPLLDDAYDPKSKEHIIAGTYPTKEDMVLELNAFENVLSKHNVEILRPKAIPSCNQIFTRDIAFAIDDTLVLSNILPDREQEQKAIQYIIDEIDTNKVISPPTKVHVEGGDVIVWNDYIFVGTYSGSDYSQYITARTNVEAVDFLKEQFPSKKVLSFELRKSNDIAKENALHLDCCFQPIGKGKAILHKNGFLNNDEYSWLLSYFGKENIFEISKEEMYHMNSNVFSISPDVVVSERNFKRLNHWMEEQGITVEAIPYSEIAKQEGLLRCSTLPLIRD